MDAEDLGSNEIRDVLEAAKLAARYKSGELSPDETRALQLWLNRSERHQSWFDTLIKDEATFPTKLEMFKDANTNTRDEFLAVCQKLEIDKKTRKHGLLRSGYFYTAIAASLIFLCTTLLLLRHFQPDTHFQAQKVQDIAPGGYHAVLTLSNSQQIVLDSVHKGQSLGSQGNTQLTRTADGDLAYVPSGAKTSEVLYNTLTTRKGDTYKVILPDGSAVWLNSGSSLRFPTQFTGKSREVTLTGEGYLEIASQPGRPFILHTANETVQVLGTRYDVSAYSDEAIHAVSLLDGAVRVSTVHGEQLLKGASQVHLSSSGFQLIDQPDLDEAVAWKNGVFDFNNAPLTDIMRQLSRWYDIDSVQYQGTVKPHLFSAYISRNLPISGVLGLLSDTREISFDIQGKTVIVKNYAGKNK